MGQDQAAVFAALESPDAYPHRTEDIHVIETHISRVYLTGPYAYKVKKSVRLPFVDFSTLALRERACRDEVALNRRQAAPLYDAVVGIGGEPGAIRIGGKPIVEFAVRMAQFPAGATAHELILDNALQAPELAELAEHVARFHASLPAESTANPAAGILANLAELETASGHAMRNKLDEIARWLRSTLARCEGVIASRSAAGFVRECHGDLHLGNVVRFQGALVPFDCVEFSRELRTIDVIDEAAFMFMDLAAHGRRDLAFTFLNRYLGVTGDYAGLGVLRLYVAHRALVRAKVAIASPRASPVPHMRQHAARYLETALAQTRAPKPVCIMTMGLSGSGKTTLARRLAPSLGAIHVRSDVERKRLHGMQPQEKSHSGLARGIYDEASSEATYRYLATAARASLAGRVDIIVDASFIRRHDRDLLRSVAGRHDARILILECTAPARVLRDRITARRQENSDASEADLAVLKRQRETADPIGDDERRIVLTIDTEAPVEPDRLAAEIRARTDQLSLSSTSY